MERNVINGHIGKNTWTIYKYDCIQAMNKMGSESIDCILTSPPYGAKRAYGEIGHEQGNAASYKYSSSGIPLPNEIGNGQNLANYYESLAEVFSLCYRILKKNRFFFLNIGNIRKNFETIDYSHTLIKKAKNAGFNHRDTIIWVKSNPRPVPPNSFQYWLDFGWEYLLMFSKGKAIINRLNYQVYKSSYICNFCKGENIKSKKSKPNYFQTNIGFVEDSLKSIHPAKFPLDLPRFALKLCTNKNDTILDPFSGIGTTLVAGLELKLNVVGCEINTSFVKSTINEFSILNSQRRGF